MRVVIVIDVAPEFQNTQHPSGITGIAHERVGRIQIGNVLAIRQLSPDAPAIEPVGTEVPLTPAIEAGSGGAND